MRPGSRPTRGQQEILDDFGHVPIQWLVAANRTGKGSVGARLVTWLVEGKIPKWKRPVKWGNSPVLILICARTGKHIEDSILPKIESYLDPDTYKVVRVGNTAQRIEFKSGARIVFQSLENPRVARERVQSYTAHMVWIDEQIPSLALLGELLMRVQADGGYFLATFTPLIVDSKLKLMVEEAALPYSKRYKLRTLDNPLFSSEEEKNQLLNSLANLPESERRARLEGDWVSPEGVVFHFNYDSMVRDLPTSYSRTWRHVEAVDPATESKLGLTIWTEDPADGSWYCMHAEYISDVYVPTLIVAEVTKRSQQLNITRRIYDPEATWYVNTARHMGYTYIPVFKKNLPGRKQEMLKNTQQALADNKIYITPGCIDLIDELQEMRFSDTVAGKIVNESSYHLIDSTNYFNEMKPPIEHIPRNLTAENWTQYLVEYNDEVERRKQDRRKPVDPRSWRKAWR